jgi:hypothetical protein
MTTREANPNTDRRDEKETTSLRAAVRKDNQQCNSSQGTSDTPGNGWDDDRVDVAERARHHYRHHTENITSLASDVRTRTVQPPNDDDDSTDMETVRAVRGEDVTCAQRRR